MTCPNGGRDAVIAWPDQARFTPGKRAHLFCSSGKFRYDEDKLKHYSFRWDCM